jgi:diguanylate cyclase (GGDEF)-like protein
MMESKVRSDANRKPLAAITRAEAAGQFLLKDVALDSVWPLLVSCPIRELMAGDVLISPGDTDRSFYLVLAGTLEVYLGGDRKHRVAGLEAGESVGELALIDQQPRSASVVAVEDCRVLVLSESAFWSLLNASHEATLNLLHIMSTRLRDNNSNLTESRRLQLQYQRHASLDGLTGLHNRRWLDEVGPRQIKRSQMQGESVSLIMMDIDYFKHFNDRFGHQAGDFVLFAVARVLQARLRPTDRVIRYGGEEFTVLLPDTDSKGAQVAAERVRQAVAETLLVMPDGTELGPVTISCGVAEMQRDETLGELLRRADAALYRAKASGRNRVQS